MKKLTYGNQMTIGIIQLVICHILAHLINIGWIINLGWIVYGLLFLLHPVVPKSAEGHPKVTRYVRIAGVIIILFGVMLRNNLDTDLTTEQLGLDVTDGTVVSSYNDYGGFHGDGVRYEVRTFEDTRVLNEIKIAPSWQPLPLTENLEILIYGKEFPGGRIGPFFSSSVDFPEVENGYYYFYDEQTESTDDTGILDRGSYNYIFAIYDCDANVMYFCTYDT